MRALVKFAAGRGNVAIADREAREPRAGEVVVTVLAAGVCGTDLHIFEDEYRSEPPVTMGHEVCGLVTALGGGVDPAWLGARVVCETYFSTCGACAWCRDGRPNLCPQRRSIGSFEDGAFAPLLVVPAQCLHRVPEWLDSAAASLAEPLACVCQCLLDPGVVAPGDRVLVTGPGPIGLIAAQVALAAGGSVLVVGTASDELRLQAARLLGCETALAADPDGLARFAAAGGADVVIECSGTGAGAAACLQHARRGGRYVQIGLAGRPVELPLDEICFRELTVTSGFASTPRSWRRALALIESRRVDLGALVTEVAPLEEWERVFADLRAGKAIKIVFDPRLAVA